MYNVQQYNVYLKNKMVGIFKESVATPLRPTFRDGTEFTTYLTYLFRQGYSRSQICRAMSAISALIDQV